MNELGENELPQFLALKNRRFRKKEPETEDGAKPKKEKE